MPNDNSEKLLRDLKRKTKLYAEKTTQLSNMLEEVVDFLRQIPGKTEVVVGDHQYDKLEFIRNGDTWDLWYGPDSDEGGWVTKSSVSIKAAAAKMLPRLFEKLLGEQSAHLLEVEKGLEALNSLPLFSDDAQGGGK